MKRLNGICTNQNQFKYMIEMDMYEVTIETVSHWALQKSVYNQHICNTYLTNNQKKIFFPCETMLVPFKVGLNVCRFKCIIMLLGNGRSEGSVFMQR